MGISTPIRATEREIGQVPGKRARSERDGGPSADGLERRRGQVTPTPPAGYTRAWTTPTSHVASKNALGGFQIFWILKKPLVIFTITP